MRSTPIFVDLCYTSFVEFEDSRDADDAINDLDGKSICGRRVQIELAKGDRNARREGGDRYGGDRYGMFTVDPIGYLRFVCR